MKFLEQRHDLVAGAAIKGAGRLIGQDEHWLIYERSSDGDALLLASGELTWPMVSAMTQADALQSLCGSAVSLEFRESQNRRAAARHFPTRLNERRSVGNWKTKPISRFLMAARRRSVSAATSFRIQRVVAGIRSLQQPQKIHQGGFARTRTAANGDKFALPHSKETFAIASMRD